MEDTKQCIRVIGFSAGSHYSMGELLMEEDYSSQDISQLLDVGCCKLFPLSIESLHRISIELEELREVEAIPSHVLLNQTDPPHQPE